MNLVDFERPPLPTWMGLLTPWFWALLFPTPKVGIPASKSELRSQTAQFLSGFQAVLVLNSNFGVGIPCFTVGKRNLPEDAQNRGVKAQNHGL